MGNSYISFYVHVVFSTKEREKSITPEIQERLWQYIGGLARDRSIKAMVVGGTDDHVHLFLSVPSTITIAKAVQEIKSLSSKWVHENFNSKSGFAWQKGYGAFSVGVSHKQKTIDYISDQAEHHRKKTFKEEYLTFLRKNNIDYDEKYIWG